MSKKAIAEKHTGFGVPPRVCSRQPMTQVGFIKDIIVDQSGNVNEFNDDTQRAMPIRDTTRGPTSQQGQARTQSLASRSQHVLNIAVHP